MTVIYLDMESRIIRRLNQLTQMEDKLSVIKGKFERKKEIRMWSDQSGTPVYLENVDWSDLGMRERQPGERVHIRDQPWQECLVCGMRTGVWVASETTHALHKDRCT